MAMDTKDLRAEATLTEHSNDGGAKFALQYDRSKSHDAGATAFKGDTGVRPCAVIGPDRVVPPAREGHKKTQAEPWLAPDPIYRRLPDYPYNMPDHKDPTRNISPRQTFQENMQRIIMPPGFNTTKLHEESPFSSKNTKLNVPTEVKYCEVPYNVNQVSSDQKHIRKSDHSASNVNPLLLRGVPHGWPAGSVHVRPLRTFGAPEVLPYPDYANCTGPRPVLTRTHEEPLYPDPYYHESNMRFKPYPNIKERYPQNRYEYLGNYPSPYHPSNPFAHKYELPKAMPPHSYPSYPQVPKYTERIPEPLMDGYQRALSQQGNYGVPIRNPVIHSAYRPVPGNHMQNKLNPYPPDGQHKPVPNKLPYDPASKMYLDYDNRSKPLPMTDNYYLNDLSRQYHVKNSIALPNYASSSMHGVNQHPYYIKENMALKNYEYSRYKNIEPHMINHSLTKLPSQFSPSTLAISPADSNASNETALTHGTSQEDCGYVSQSSVTSVRSIESLNRIPMDPYGRYDYRYGPIVRASPSTKPDPNGNRGSKSNKDIRQFISSWSEGDDENAENGAKRDVVKNITEEKQSFNKQYEAVNNQGPLYVLGLVNVPSEELSKYEHIQKVSKLPENIKGYNSLELLNQFEEAIESSNISSVKTPTPRTVQMPLKSLPHRPEQLPRALSPLDVESKISQSVIHKEVGCNFEIKPCSPKMLNVEMATPMQMLNERVIEKVTNPRNIKSPIMLQGMDKNLDHSLINKTIKCPVSNMASSCKMVNNQHLTNSPTLDHLKTSYTLQDLESNSGVCLASLPRLDTDIELNFPEVNQQFINANKTDSVITTPLTKNLPALDVDRSDILSTECDINYQYSPKMETETDFSKLSKYRKLKRCVPDESDTAVAKVQATRVDSVIIKNPDNTRSHEESTDNSGSNFKDDLQEFAMNLVSQTKHSKHQHDMDKIFETSTNSAITGGYDDVKINSPISCMPQSSPSLNKQFNVIEETSRNNVVGAQTEDLNMHNKDLSNRYLEKAALDIPMNLSPQARNSIEVEEEIRKSELDYKTNELNGKHQFAAHNTCLVKKIQNEEKYARSVNKDQPVGTLINLPNDVSDSQCFNTRNELLKKTNTPGCSFESKLISRSDKNEYEQDQPISQFDLKTVDNKKEEKTIFENSQMAGINEKSAVTETTTKIDSENIFCANEEQDQNESQALCSDEVNYEETINYSPKEHKKLSDQYRKNHKSVSYVPKIKRKKFRGEVAYQNRSYENNSVNVVDHNVDNIMEKQNLTTLPKSTEDLVEQLPQNQAQTPPEEVNVEENNKRQSDLICADINNDAKPPFAKASKDIRLRAKYAQKKRRVVKKYNKEITSKNFTDKINSNLCRPCSPIKDKCSDKIYISEMKTSLHNDLPLDTDTDIKNVTENTYSDFSSNLTSEGVVSSKIIDNNASETVMSSDKIELEEELFAPESVNMSYETKELNILDEPNETERHNITMVNLKNNDLNTVVPSGLRDNEDKYIKASSVSFDEKHVNTLDFTDKEEPETDKGTHLVYDHSKTPLQQNESELQKQNLFGIISTKSENQCHDFQMCGSGDVGIQCKIKNDLCQARQNPKNDPVCHAFVNKELFSSQFQNLLFYNVLFDIRTDAGKPNVVYKQCNLEYSSHDPVTNDPITSLYNQAGINTETPVNIICNRENRVLNSSNQVETIDTAVTIEEPNSENIDEEMFESTSPKNNNINMDQDVAKDVDLVFGECTVNESESINNVFPETRTKSVDEAGIITDAYTYSKSVDNSVSKLSGLEVVDKCDENAENNYGESKIESQFTNKVTIDKPVDKSGHKASYQEIYDESDKNLECKYGECESDFQITNNIESDACSTNIIVIDESLSVSPTQCNENRKIETPLVNELDKKIQSFVENFSVRPRFSLKRSLSDSALNEFDDDNDESLDIRSTLTKKRKKLCDIGKIDGTHLLNIIQSSRRNSVSTLSNDNFSFCILIDDNCIVAEENYEQENFMQLDDNLFNNSLKSRLVEEEKNASPVYNLTDQNENTSDTYITKYDEEKVWVEDVGCEETIETEDIAENIVIGDPASPKDTDSTDYESEDDNMDTLNNEAADHTSKVKHIYGDNMCTNDAQLVDALYRTPQMDVNKKLMDKESHTTEKAIKYYDSDSLEMLLAEPVNSIPRAKTESNLDCINLTIDRSVEPVSVTGSMNKVNEDSDCLGVSSPLESNIKEILANDTIPNEKPIANDNCDEPQEGKIHSCESGLENVFSYVDEKSSHRSSSSPEVSSTTSEEKNSSILLKISNFKGSRISEVKNTTCEVNNKQKQNSSKHTTEKYFNTDYTHGASSKRPLLTKAAQKYIPPLRESIPDLRVKLALPQQSLLKLQKNKIAKEEPKFSTRNIRSNNNNIKLKKEIPKKIKPKFEDVLKNIDEAQLQLHKAKSKQSKKYIPKVVIKKSENGSHYASTCAKTVFNPDLTGRKWQPWVFIEKNKFIDNMALRNKTRAVFSHRRKSFVLAEKFCKYKSISSAKFVISQPKLDDLSTGNLKYTIKLKQR